MTSAEDLSDRGQAAEAKLALAALGTLPEPEMWESADDHDRPPAARSRLLMARVADRGAALAHKLGEHEQEGEFRTRELALHAEGSQWPPTAGP